VSAGRTIALAVALGLVAAGAAQAAELLQVRAEGSFPLQYVESLSGSRRNNLTAAPYLGLIGTVGLQHDLTSSVFVNGGHPPLGSFRDTDDTFVSAGADLVRHWGALRAGTSLEYTQYYDGVFAATSRTATDANLFVGYRWQPTADLRVRPGASVAMRLDESFAVQRYSFNARLAVEHRIVGQWWAVVSPRFRYSHYVGADSGRRDTRAAIVGGLRYDFNDSVSASLLAGYETRNSNVPNRSGERLIAGASLDFDIDFMRPRGVAAR
jgi:hypothetical protein